MNRTDLSVDVRRDTTEAVVTLTGEIDMSTVHKLTAAVDEVLATEPPPKILLDLAGVRFCDSQGLGTLVVLSRRSTIAHSCLVLTNIQDFLLRVLDITGLRGALLVKEQAS